jgi:hypothetical protein
MLWRAPRERHAGEARGRRWRGLLGVLAIVGTIAWLLACGGDPKRPVAVQVGAIRIDTQTVAHWRRVVARGQMLGGFGSEFQGTELQRALATLISAARLRGEAAALGVSPPAGRIRHALDDQREANGAGEFERTLRSARQTVADLELELTAKLAAEAIREAVNSRSPKVTEREVADFYARNRSRLFRIPEQRTADLIEDLASPAAATALVGRIGTGRAFTKKALHEKLQPVGASEHFEPDIERVTRAIFAARLGAVSRPMSLNGHWTVFIVRAVTPPSFTPLAHVRTAIVARLAARHRQATLSSFVRAYRRHWTAKTSCGASYVVPGCSQYRGPERPEPDPFAGE